LLELSDEQFDSIYYIGMAIYKIGILLFNLLPLVSMDRRRLKDRSWWRMPNMDLEVLCVARGPRLGIVERVDHAYSVYRLLRDAINDNPH